MYVLACVYMCTHACVYMCTHVCVLVSVCVCAEVNVFQHYIRQHLPLGTPGQQLLGG